MEQVGRIASQLIVQSTASQDLSVERPRSLKPETLADCRAITAWAEATMPVRQAAPAARVTKRLEYLDANLPRKQQDDKGGELRTAALLAILSPYSDDALAFMVREACRRFKWFPTAKELLDILADYVAPVSEQETALIECRHFASEAFVAWLNNIAAGQPIGDVPEQWCRIAVERGTMRRLSDGSYVTRALYQGPVKAWAPEPRLPALPIAAEPMREAA